MSKTGESLGTGLVGLLVMAPLAVPAYLGYSVLIKPFFDQSTADQAVEPRGQSPVEVDLEPPSPVLQDPEESPVSTEQAWVCGYSPTYNYDWHDDVLCSNGLEEDRPYLLEGDSFVDQNELAEAAQEHEDLLNSR